jgi:hypothetical protein
MSYFVKETSFRSTKVMLTKGFDLLNKYYFIIIGLYFLKKAINIALHSNSGDDYKAYIF